MSRSPILPSGRERSFGKEEIIVTKTDQQGRVTYANRVFMRVSGFDEAEILGRPHSFIRHPDMPRSVFKLLWDTVQDKREIFAYVLNLAKNGDHYWVFAHVTPTLDAAGQVTGFHSNRRTPDGRAVEAITPVYAALRAAEGRAPDKKGALAAGEAVLTSFLRDRNTSYGEFVFSL